MALKILLADPDEKWLESTKKYFEDNQYIVEVATRGREAQTKISANSYFTIILNYALQDHSCLQVMKFIQMNYTNQKVIVIINDQKILDDLEVEEYQFKKAGASEILVKPFEWSQLGDLLEGHQNIKDIIGNLKTREGQSQVEEVALKDELFTGIKIDEFLSGKGVLFDVFIKISEGKYLKILHAGDSFSMDRIEKYKKEKNVTMLYFHQKDRQKYIQYSNFIVKNLVGSDKVSTKVKVGLLKGLSQTMIEEAFSVGLKPQVVDQAKEVCENVYQMIEKQGDLYQALKDLNDLDPDAFTHAFLTSLYSSAIIKQFDWQSKLTIETVAMACMFHDIGKLKMSKETVRLRPENMMSEQLEQYHNHPVWGVEIIQGNRLINNSVKQIILQHHEFFDGTGFPGGLKRSKIQTLSNICALANQFAHVLQDEKIKPVAAVRQLLMTPNFTARFSSQIIEKFIQVFADPSTIKKEVDIPSNSRMVKRNI